MIGMLIEIWALASIKRKYLIKKKKVLHLICFYHKFTALSDAFNGTW